MSVGYHDRQSVRINKIKIITRQYEYVYNLWNHRIAIVCCLGGESLHNPITFVNQGCIPNVYYYFLY